MWKEIARRWGKAHGDEFLALQMIIAMHPGGNQTLPSGAYQNIILTLRYELESRYGLPKEA